MDIYQEKKVDCKLKSEEGTPLIEIIPLVPRDYNEMPEKEESEERMLNIFLI